VPRPPARLETNNDRQIKFELIQIRIRSAGAQRMALYRERRRKGLRCVMIELLDVEINMLIRHGWLARDKRADPVALRDAFHVMLDDVLR
jgi:hypothetical protein